MQFKRRIGPAARCVAIQPKPVQVIDQLAAGTGGLVFPIDNARVAAKSICDELRNNRYLLAYSASGIPFGDSGGCWSLGRPVSPCDQKVPSPLTNLSRKRLHQVQRKHRNNVEITKALAALQPLYLKETSKSSRRTVRGFAGPCKA